MVIRLSRRAARLGGFASTTTEARSRSKYGNVPTRYDSRVVGLHNFDSAWEAKLCRILDDMAMTGEIRTFLIQVPIRLGVEDQKGRARIMRVDFLVIDNRGRAHWWDAKGKATAAWMFKRDVAWKRHRIDVRPIYKGKPLPRLDDEGDDDR